MKKNVYVIAHDPELLIEIQEHFIEKGYRIIDVSLSEQNSDIIDFVYYHNIPYSDHTYGSYRENEEKYQSALNANIPVVKAFDEEIIEYSTKKTKRNNTNSTQISSLADVLSNVSVFGPTSSHNFVDEELGDFPIIHHSSPNDKNLPKEFEEFIEKNGNDIVTPFETNSSDKDSKSD